jgi:hypothetical protein
VALWQLGGGVLVVVVVVVVPATERIRCQRALPSPRSGRNKPMGLLPGCPAVFEDGEEEGRSVGEGGGGGGGSICGGGIGDG